jgi:hypothetical protein
MKFFLGLFLGLFAGLIPLAAAVGGFIAGLMASDWISETRLPKYRSPYSVPNVDQKRTSSSMTTEATSTKDAETASS